jgi:mono/diheme cytochrome c family protein
VVLLSLGLGITAAIWSGAYDVGADAPHGSVARKVLEQLRSRSVAHRVGGIVVPGLDDPAMIAEGAEHYSAMCAGCHLAPGVTESEIRPGLYPQPPDLVSVGIGDPREAFWTIKHGVKMSGMPAWGTSHDDDEIWNIVAFLRRMPALTPAAYQALLAVNQDDSGEGAQREDAGGVRESDASVTDLHPHAPAHDHGAGRPTSGSRIRR